MSGYLDSFGGEVERCGPSASGVAMMAGISEAGVGLARTRHRGPYFEGSRRARDHP